jgi:hypothetical protein
MCERSVDHVSVHGGHVCGIRDVGVTGLVSFSSIIWQLHCRDGIRERKQPSSADRAPEAAIVRVECL